MKLCIFLANPSTQTSFLRRCECLGQYLHLLLQISTFFCSKFTKYITMVKDLFWSALYEKWNHLWFTSPKKAGRTGKAVLRAILPFLQYTKKHSRTAPYCFWYQKMRQMWEKDYFKSSLRQLLSLKLILDATYDNKVLTRVSRHTQSNYSLGALDN